MAASPASPSTRPGPKARQGARPVPGGPPPAVAVQHFLVTYAKRGRMRFASHRDVGRAFERAVRAAGLPMAWSAGFSPHPKISYASGTQTGVASEAEYLTLALTAAQDPDRLRSALDTALPDGIDVIEVREDSGGALNSRLTVSEWLVELPGITPDAAVAAARQFLAAAEAQVERTTKNGTRRLDARAAVLTMEAGPRVSGDHSDACAIIRMVIRHTEPAVRPEDVLTALRQIAGLSPASSPAVTRVAQGVLGDDGLTVPGPVPRGRLRRRDAPAGHSGPAGRGRTRRPHRRPGKWTCHEGADAPHGLRTRAVRRHAGPLFREAARPLCGCAARGTVFATPRRTETGNEPGRGSRRSGRLRPGEWTRYAPARRAGPLVGPRARELDGRLPGCSRTSRTTENLMMGQVDQTTAR